MSEYHVLELELEDTETIKETLKELGYSFEEHKTAVSLFGYLGDRRAQKANIVVRREHVGSASNDVGFFKKPNGKYELIISEFDQRQKQGKMFTQKFKQVYVTKQTKKHLKKKGYKLKKQKVEKDGTIELRFA